LSDFAYFRLKDKKASVRKYATEAVLGLFHWFCHNRIASRDHFMTKMGSLFEATSSMGEIRSAFFKVTAKDGFFPPTLSPGESAKVLGLMYSRFSEKQRSAFLKTLEYKYSLQVFRLFQSLGLFCRQVSISGFVECLLSGMSVDSSLGKVVPWLSERDKAKTHFLKLTENKDRNIVRVLGATCGMQSLPEVRHFLPDVSLSSQQKWKEGKKELSMYVGSRSAAGEFFRALCDQTSPFFLSAEILDHLFQFAAAGNLDPKFFIRLSKARPLSLINRGRFLS